MNLKKKQGNPGIRPLPFFTKRQRNICLFSLTEEGILPYINHPVAQSGANINSANSLTIPKHRGLMLRRGQALFVATSGATALTNAFYCNVQGGFY